jgi:hypothetical protein
MTPSLLLTTLKDRVRAIRPDGPDSRLRMITAMYCDKDAALGAPARPLRCEAGTQPAASPRWHHRAAPLAVVGTSKPVALRGVLAVPSSPGPPRTSRSALSAPALLAPYGSVC